MVNTQLKNLYKEYWIKKEQDWHQNIIGEYHVSSIGFDNSYLDPVSHTGPCLRQTFYDYIAPKERSDETEGNFGMGNLLHKACQKIYKKNHPNSVIEFPLQQFIKLYGEQVKIMGSIDIVLFEPLKNGKISVTIIDLKSASDWTFPKNKDHKNLTHFNQVYIYTYWLLNNILNSDVVKIKELKIVYMNKHNKYTGEQVEPYDNEKGGRIFINFLGRVNYLHAKLLGMELPAREPMRWCKLCDYRVRCKDNLIHDPHLTISEVEIRYNEETGKSPKWRSKYTKQFLKFKEGFSLVEIVS